MAAPIATTNPPAAKPKPKAKKIKTASQLAAEKLARSRARKDKNPLYTPGTPLGGHTLSESAHDLAELDTRPQLQAIDTASQTAQTQGQAVAGRAAGYYQQLAQQAADSVARQHAISGQLNDTLGGLTAQTQARVAQAGQEQQTKLAADAQLRGGGLSGGADDQAATEQAAQTDRAAQDAGAYQAAGAKQGSNYEGLTNVGSTAAAQRGGEQLGELNINLLNSLAKLRTQRQQVQAGEGADETKQLLGLRQSEFNNLATEQGLGIKAADIQQQAAQARSQARLGTAKLTEKAKADHLAHLDRQYQSALTHNDRQAALSYKRQMTDYQKKYGLGPFKPSSGTGTKEPASAVGLRRGITNAVDLLQQGHSVHYLQTQKAAPDVVRAAQEINQQGYLSPDTQRSLEELGVQIPAEWLYKGSGYQGPH